MKEFQSKLKERRFSYSVNLQENANAKEGERNVWESRLLIGSHKTDSSLHTLTHSTSLSWQPDFDKLPWQFSFFLSFFFFNFFTLSSCFWSVSLKDAKNHLHRPSHAGSQPSRSCPWFAPARASGGRSPHRPRSRTSCCAATKKRSFYKNSEFSAQTAIHPHTFGPVTGLSSPIPAFSFDLPSLGWLWLWGAASLRCFLALICSISCSYTEALKSSPSKLGGGTQKRSLP